MTGLVVAFLTFFDTWRVWFKSYGELVLIWGMDMEFKDKLMLHCFPEMKCQQGFTTEIGYSVGNVLGYTMVNVPYRSLEGEISNRLFNSNIVSLVWKTNEQRGRAEAERLIFLFCSLECLNCWQVGGGGVRQIVLFWFYHFLFFIFLPFVLLHAY